MLEKAKSPEQVESGREKIEKAETELFDKAWLSYYLTANTEFREQLSKRGLKTGEGVRVISSERNSVGVAGMVFTCKLEQEGTPNPLTIYVKHHTEVLPQYPHLIHGITPEERARREIQALQTIKDMEIQGLILPDIVSIDHERNLLISLEIDGSDGSQMISPQEDTGMEASLGKIIAKIHLSNYDPEAVVGMSDENMAKKVFDFRSAGAQKEYGDDNEFLEAINAFYKESVSNMNCRTHGDLTPRNVRSLPDNRISMFDLEFSAERGDPATDIGFFLAHYALESLKNPDKAETINEKAVGFWNAYKETIGSNTNIDVGKLEERAVKYISTTLFYRGWFTPSMPLDPEKQQVVYDRAREVFDFQSLNEVFPQAEPQ